MSEVKPAPVTPMTAQEYAKITAAKERVRGLRSGIWACGVIAVTLATIVFLSVYASEFTTSQPLAYRDGLTYGILTIIPFIAIIGYFSYRINLILERLSNGKFERRRKIRDEE